VASSRPQDDRSRSGAEQPGAGQSGAEQGFTTPPPETPATAAADPELAVEVVVAPAVDVQPVPDAPWDEAWLPQWVSDADLPVLGAAVAELTDGELPDEPPIPDADGAQHLAPATALAGPVAEPAPTATVPARRPLPPRIDAALAELREAELTARRAAEEQAAAQLAAWEEAIRAGDALADRAASTAPPAAPPSPPAAPVDVPSVRTPPTDARRRTRVLLPLAVLLVAGLLAGFSFVGSSSGDRAEVAAAERDATRSTSSSTSPRTAAPVPRAEQPVDPPAGVVPVDVLAEQSSTTTTSASAARTARATARSTTAADTTSPAAVPAPTVVAGPTGPVSSTSTGGTGSDATGSTGTAGSGPEGTGTDGVPTDGVPTDGTGPGGDTGIGSDKDPELCPPADDTGDAGSTGGTGGTDGAGSTGGTGGTGGEDTGELAGACGDGSGGGTPISTDGGDPPVTAEPTPSTTLSGRRG
jgi:hypothetical protein